MNLKQDKRQNPYLYEYVTALLHTGLDLSYKIYHELLCKLGGEVNSVFHTKYIK